MPPASVLEGFPDPERVEARRLGWMFFPSCTWDTWDITPMYSPEN